MRRIFSGFPFDRKFATANEKLCVCGEQKTLSELSTACRVKWSLDAVNAVFGAGKNCCSRLSRKTFRKAGEPGDGGGEGIYAFGFENWMNLAFKTKDSDIVMKVKIIQQLIDLVVTFDVVIGVLAS